MTNGLLIFSGISSAVVFGFVFSELPVKIDVLINFKYIKVEFIRLQWDIFLFECEF